MSPTGAGPTRVAVCAKSPWDPAIRREHALARAAAGLRVSVEFIERPQDVRSPGPRRPVRLVPGSDAGSAVPVRVHPRWSPVPGHRSRWAGVVDSAVLRRRLERVQRDGRLDAVVVNAPWQWAATATLPPETRRIFDLADDWRTLLPDRAERIRDWYRRIDAEADEVIVAAGSLGSLFTRAVVLVPNGVGPEVLAAPPTPPPGRCRMVYLGTLSERFDAGLMSGVLDRLPSWRLDLYGPQAYAGRSVARLALVDLMRRHGSRVDWHGPVPRADVRAVLDAGDVLVLPNDVAISVGQDSMKLYDYAARGRPVVATLVPVARPGPPGLRVARSAADFAAAVAGSPLSPAEVVAQRDWVSGHRWDERIRPWLTAVLGGPS